jgi:hypothetical protein
MGINSPKKVWVGVIGGWMSGIFEVRASTTLKGLCEEIGTNYETAKDRVGVGGEGPVTLYEGVGDEKRAWSVKRVEVRKVLGRGKRGSR